MAGTSAVVLLKDVTGDLTFNKSTLFNLNGFKVNGNLTANAKTIVIDSNIDDFRNGEVTGKVSGNVIIVAGKYSDDVSAFIKNGFVQDADGAIVNQYYSISKDSAGNVTISIDAALAGIDEKPSIAGIALDIACDLLFNGYTSNYLELDGNLIYNIKFDDLVGLYASSNRVDTVISETMEMVDSEQLSKFINTVLDDVLDFDAISKAIANGTPVFEYDMVTRPWAVEIVHVKDGDYVSGNLTSGKNANVGKIRICVVGNEDDKAFASDFFKELSETIPARQTWQCLPVVSGVT